MASAVSNLLAAEFLSIIMVLPSSHTLQLLAGCWALIITIRIINDFKRSPISASAIICHDEIMWRVTKFDSEFGLVAAVMVDLKRDVVVWQLGQASERANNLTETETMVGWCFSFGLV
ncbi:hypothetical protein N7501_009611 [Penicillium viridicatum]|nr:hypothetical protein N7501_009611 [Penicillium viridicatum]